ncbi:hypothetical protein CRUP_037090 [Coryphaenoides rupestris]|nr:hypothetical protein CRUP_037090 [Coryphaenoides rupestris]
MLHYLSLGDKSWSTCPICYEAVHTMDLKSVVAMETRQYAVGDLISMRLMRREKGALVAMPSSQWVKVEETVRFEDPSLSQYSKLLLASPAQVMRLLAEEKAALQLQLSQEEDSQSCFIQSALCHLQEREDALLMNQKAAEHSLDLSNFTMVETVLPVEEVLTTTSSSPKPVLQYTSAFDDEVAEIPEEGPEEGPQLPGGILESLLEEEVTEGATADPDQEPLEKEEEIPFDRGSEGGCLMGPMAHVPYYYFYQDDLEKRKRLRQKKARDEKRRERRIEMEENRKQGKYPEVHIGLENLQQFPAFSSSPQNCSPMVQLDFTLAPLSPLSSSPVSDMLLAPPAPDSEGESDGSDRVPVPSFQNSFSQAFEEALQQMDSGPSAPASAQCLVIPDDKGGKKKKKKQKILFSTSLVHTK